MRVRDTKALQFLHKTQTTPKLHKIWQNVLHKREFGLPLSLASQDLHTTQKLHTFYLKHTNIIKYGKTLVLNEKILHERPCL